MEELTQPAPLTAHARPRAAAAEWCLTLAFHPDVTRIGEQAALPVRGQPLSLGRANPCFSPPFVRSPCEPRGLQDRRVSRRALRLLPRDGGWLLQRDGGSSRLRIDGEAVDREIFLPERRLRDGVVLSLGHAVLLHLRLRDALDDRTRRAEPVPGLLGVSPAMRRSFADIRRAARGSGDVLLLGPTGTGKDVAARAIHAGSAHSDKPLVAVNMAALAPELAAASLFGVRRGAYTGADRHRPGYFQRAAGGTLFLDEVGDTPPALQALLLRALQDRELQVVGGEIERVELRVIAATEFDLDAPDSGFRAALRYRLAAREVRLPALGERREDIGLIAAAACADGGRQRGRPWMPAGAGAGSLARWVAAFEALLLRQWPGNVRELLHCVNRLLDSEDVLPELPAASAPAAAAAPSGIADAGPAGTDAGLPGGPAGRRAWRALSDGEFLRDWELNGFEVARMARQHGVSRQAVYRRVRRLQQCRLAADVPLRELLDTLRDCRGDLAATARRLTVSAAGLKQRLRGVALDDAQAVPTPSASGSTAASGKAAPG